MINSVSLRNVRVFRNKDTVFPLADLCVFCGTNSSGKSSILKSILLLRQSQGIDEPVRARNGVLRFVGTQVDLGKFATFVSDRQADAEISIGIEVPHSIDIDQLRFLRALSPQSRPHEEDDNRGKPQCKVRVQLIFQGLPTKGDDTNRTTTTASAHGTGQQQGTLKSAYFTLNTPTENLLSWHVHKTDDPKTGAPAYRIRLSSRYFEEVGGRRIMDVDSCSDTAEVELTTVLDGLLPASIIARIRREQDKKGEVDTERKERWSIYPLPPQIEAAIESLKTALTQVHYMGPLRAPARRYYVNPSDSPPSMDPSGEFLPSLLALDDEPQVDYIPPKQHKLVKHGLFTALDQWLYFIRTGEVISSPAQQHEVKVTSLKGVLVELEVPSPNDAASHSLADSGFGYSQVLPILVRGLMAARKSSIIVEQPELHLNPGVQIRLAEFFVSLVLAGKQILLETHSEHMVNAVRVLVAEEETGSLDGRCNIFYIRAAGNGPQVQPLSIDANGTVAEWPYEFFGEAATLAGRLLRAQKKYRQTRNTKE